MEETGCEIICGVPTTIAAKGQMRITMMVQNMSYLRATARTNIVSRELWRDESKRQINKMAATESATIIEDLKDERIPNAMYWTVSQVADWIEELGFPHYKSCFTTNMIDGRHLIRIEASAFPRIGITDFEHIKIIAKSIRDLLTVEEPDWTRSISLPPRSDLGMYLEVKSARGKQIDTTTMMQFEQKYPSPKWRPPLANHCLILPHD